MRSKVLTALCFATMFALVAWADAWDKKTTFTIDQTIRVPGAILQPGTYVIKLVESLSDRHIVMITNEKEDHVLTTILAIPNYRLTPTGDTKFAFWETPAGAPKAMRAWFYPGDNFGQEFAYPKHVATAIAQNQNTETLVPATAATKQAEMPKAPVTTIEKSGTERQYVAEAAPAPMVPPPAVAPPAPVQAAQADQPALPATASPLPAFALAALLALAAGVTLRFAAS